MKITSLSFLRNMAHRPVAGFTGRFALLFLCFLPIMMAELSPAYGADSFIWINVSMKLVVSPTDGLIPGNWDTNRANQWFTMANQWLANTYRGYRLRVVDNYPQIGTPNPADSTNPSWWFNTPLKGTDNLPNFTNFEAAAHANAAFRWNSNAVNIYVNNALRSWSSSGYTKDGLAMIETGYGLVADSEDANDFAHHPEAVAANLLHEIGHHFELFHPFDGKDVTDETGVSCQPNDDCIGDTLLDYSPSEPDDSTTIRDTLAALNFTNAFTSVAFSDQNAVTNAIRNVMSYHQRPATNITPVAEWPLKLSYFSEMQLDKWANFANTSRRGELSGRTWFISTMGNDDVANGGITSTLPKQTLTATLNATNASNGDVLLLESGAYNEKLTVSKAVTLRVRRNSLASIGTSASP